MRKTIAAAGVALALGALGGSALSGPSLAGAQDGAEEPPAEERVAWAEDALDGLVQDGAITEGQADEVLTTLKEARPERPRLRRLLRHCLDEAEPRDGEPGPTEGEGEGTAA